MTAPDPVDAHLLALVAEVGRVAVHDLAKRAGLDPREVAARLAALAASGLPLVVGVECDPAKLRFALARQGWTGQPGTVSGPHPVNPPSGSYPQPMPYGPAGPPSGPLPTPGHPAHSQPVPATAYPNPNQSGPVPAGTGPASGRVPMPAFGAVQQPTSNAMGTWGPPQSATWARGDQQPSATTTLPSSPANVKDPGQRTGVVGDVLHTEGPEGEQLTIQLVEVVDPADFLFTAAGYRLQPGERSVVVHTELTNRGTVPFAALPDLYLVLLDTDGAPVSKAPVSLSSRPPHRIGVQPAETAGGHTVYVLPESTEIAAVRWSPRPGDEHRWLIWTLRD